MMPRLADTRWIALGYQVLRKEGWPPRWAYYWACSARRRVYGVSFT